MSSDMNRRAILTGTATLPVTALPAIGAEPDPIFAAIESHRAARQRYSGSLEIEDWDGPIVDEAHDAARNTMLTLLDIMPTTLAGVAALLRYSADFDEKEPDCCPGFLGYDEDADLPEEHSREWFDVQHKGQWHLWLQRHAADALDRIA
jgi:hypothetical protein